MTADTTPASPSDVPVLLARAAGAGPEAEAAWRELVSRYARRIFALARSRRLGEEAAEEVAQSVFVTVSHHLRTGSVGGYEERGRFESWLFRIAVNRVRDEIRRRTRAVATADPSDLDAHSAAPAPAPNNDQADLRALRDAISRLPDADREVVELRHHGGLSFKQIADTLDQPLGTVLARHHRALRKLKEMMTPAPGKESA